MMHARASRLQYREGLRKQLAEKGGGEGEPKQSPKKKAEGDKDFAPTADGSDGQGTDKEQDLTLYRIPPDVLDNTYDRGRVVNFFEVTNDVYSSTVVPSCFSM